MAALENKIDFAIAFEVNNANPNGDPLNGNRPRTTSEGLGEVSDVALKRKIRNRLQDAGESVFVQSDDRSDDGVLKIGVVISLAGWGALVILALLRRRYVIK